MKANTAASAGARRLSMTVSGGSGEDAAALAGMKGAIFDVDGTLLDSSAVWDDAGERYLNRLGIQAEPGLGRKLFTMTLEEGASYLKETYKLAGSEREILEGVLQVVEDFYRYEAQLKPGAAACLEMLQERGVPMVVLSSSDETHIRAALERTGILDHFQEILTCSEIGFSKNCPEGFQLACGRLGTEPGETWVFEDALYSIKTARAAGLHALGLFDESSAADQDEIRQTADLYFTSLSQFTAFCLGERGEGAAETEVEAENGGNRT